MDHGIRIYFCNYLFNSILIGNVQSDIRCFCYCRAICYTAVVFLNIRTNAFMATLQQFPAVKSSDEFAKEKTLPVKKREGSL